MFLTHPLSLSPRSRRRVAIFISSQVVLRGLQRRPSEVGIRQMDVFLGHLGICVTQEIRQAAIRHSSSRRPGAECVPGSVQHDPLTVLVGAETCPNPQSAHTASQGVVGPGQAVFVEEDAAPFRRRPGAANAAGFRQQVAGG